MFKDRLKKLRLEANLTQKEIAENFKTSQQSYAKWESGIRNPSQKSLEKLANFFNVSIDYLTGKTDIRNPDTDIDNAIDKSVAYNGKPISDSDREAIKAFLTDYFANKD